MQEGWQQGVQEGLEKGQQKVAVNFKKLGFPVSDIAKGLGLTVEQVVKLTDEPNG